MVKNLPAMQETRVRSLGEEDPLEKGMQYTPVFLPGESHGQRSLVSYSPRGHKKVGHDLAAKQQQDACYVTFNMNQNRIWLMVPKTPFKA